MIIQVSDVKSDLFKPHLLSTITKSKTPTAGMIIQRPGDGTRPYYIEKVEGYQYQSGYEWNAEARTRSGEKRNISSNEFPTWETYQGPPLAWLAQKQELERNLRLSREETEKKDAFKRKYKFSDGTSILPGFPLQINALPLPPSLELFANERVKITNVDFEKENVGLVHETTGAAIESIPAVDLILNAKKTIPALPDWFSGDKTKFKVGGGEKTAQEMYDDTPAFTKFVIDRTVAAAAGTEPPTVELWVRVGDEEKFAADMAQFSLDRSQYGSRMRYFKMKNEDAGVTYIAGIIIRPTLKGNAGQPGSGLPPEVFQQLMMNVDATREHVIRGYGRDDTGVYIHSTPLFRQLLAIGVSAPSFNPVSTEEVD